MRLVDVITNLKNHDFDISNYPLCKAEADVFFKCAEEIEKCKNSYNEDKLDDYKNRVIGIDLNHADYVSMSSYEGYRGASDMKDDVLDIIDKYRAEREGEE